MCLGGSSACLLWVSRVEQRQETGTRNEERIGLPAGQPENSQNGGHVLQLFCDMSFRSTKKTWLTPF